MDGDLSILIDKPLCAKMRRRVIEETSWKTGKDPSSEITKFIAIWHQPPDSNGCGKGERGKIITQACDGQVEGG